MEKNNKAEDLKSLEINYNKLSDRAREILNRFAVFRKPAGLSAVHWVTGEKQEITIELIKNLDREKLPEEIRHLEDEELLKLFRKQMPEQRYAGDIDKYIDELVNLNLIKSELREGGVETYSVNIPVRNFCKDKLAAETWKTFLKEGAFYYISPYKESGKEQKTPETVLEETEGIKLLIEAEEFEEASGILLNINELLTGWGYQDICENLNKMIIPQINGESKAFLILNLGIVFEKRGEYKIALEEYNKSLEIFRETGSRGGTADSLNKIGIIHYFLGKNKSALTENKAALKIYKEIGDLGGEARTQHYLGVIYQKCRDYEPALNKFNESIKIFEEFGDKASAGLSKGQAGILLTEAGEYSRAFEKLFQAFSTFMEMKSPYEKTALNELKKLREKWGAENFDPLFKERTGVDLE